MVETVGLTGQRSFDGAAMRRDIERSVAKRLRAPQVDEVVDADGKSENAAADFMAHGYDRIREPLNLWQGGQSWFKAVFEQAIPDRDGAALLLGATPWLATLLSRRQPTIVVDRSHSMLRMCRQACEQSAETLPHSRRYILADWLDLPAIQEPIAVAVGDNSFSFMEYPGQWERLAAAIARGMCAGAMLFSRVCSVPLTHRCLTVDELLEDAMSRPPESRNFTLVRTKLLFAHWDPRSYSIQTEDVLRTFERYRSKFHRLLDGVPVDNDLETITKYRGCGAVYYAPPLDEVLRVMSREFRVLAVHFGPYEMCNYFPLIVACKVLATH